MIPDFKTYITESIWSDIQDRSMGKTVRKEDIHWYTEPFNKIKEMELIDMSNKMDLGVKYLWTPCNFGAESYKQPGLYLTYDEILELNEFLVNNLNMEKGDNVIITGSVPHLMSGESTNFMKIHTVI